ncbi:hypothetical protein PF005_g16574 [Phytophthora fragariae]|uniref:OTU domain-containing protein n=1 Tax=Phytophthora fragariae TaxID=53985 RepID=A0A6A3ELT3_9STRA|nr:hypothetical protein PF003_g39194 [Phytophthora fragariae]KAE8932881.1 hypothetical protein PF009_g17104 [Phytophthora fragariae]KAE8997153.1 hypothetical protein PF011_g15605 [Phytophthora fragariae]KAE9097323.1 hypothetical protein PF007_g16671 [Phytophthora fragariae]KAE9130031.1 hypothetical protein PF006_g15858 [Phytophthora fragariae]
MEVAGDKNTSQEGKSEERPPQPGVIEISSDDELEDKEPVPITAAEKAKLHLVKAKPPKKTPTPQLVALKQRERQALQRANANGPAIDGVLTPLPELTGKRLSDFSSIQKSLQLQPMSTPPSGNCMAIALVQAVVDDNLDRQDARLEEMTKIIKRGIRWAGQLGMATQFDHFVRTSILVNVCRGWLGVDVQESTKPFMWYLNDYANSPSDRETFIPRYNWGCSDLLAMAANFLQGKIFVLAFDADHRAE